MPAERLRRADQIGIAQTSFRSHEASAETREGKLTSGERDSASLRSPRDRFVGSVTAEESTRDLTTSPYTRLTADGAAYNAAEIARLAEVGRYFVDDTL